MPWTLAGAGGNLGGMDGKPFSGAKIALLCEARLVVYRRDDKPSIPWPGLWDLPGGGREGDETPAACALREVEEEFGLALAPTRITWCRSYPSLTVPGQLAYFFAAPITEAETAAIRFGDEGQYWTMMTCADFLARESVLPQLQDRLRDYLASLGPEAQGAAAPRP